MHAGHQLQGRSIPAVDTYQLISHIVLNVKITYDIAYHHERRGDKHEVDSSVEDGAD